MSSLIGDIKQLIQDGNEADRADFRLRLLVSAAEGLQSKKMIADWMRTFTEERKFWVTQVWNETVPASLRRGCQYVFLGSAARGEDLLYSDLDFAIILTTTSLQEIKPYLQLFIRLMYQLGFPLCLGFVMATNPRWSGTFDEWMERIHRYFTFPDWENVRFLYIMVDGIEMGGAGPRVLDLKLAERNDPESSEDLWLSIRDVVTSGIRQSPFLCWEMAHLGIYHTVAIDSFGRLRKPSGRSVNAINIKDGFLNPMIQAIRLFAIVSNIPERSTLTRLESLCQMGVLPEEFQMDIEDALNFGWRLRLTNQMNALQRNQVVSNVVTLDEIPMNERKILVKHLESAKRLENYTHRQFRKPRW